MRKLVTIKTITNIQPIPEADAIDVATVNHGWKVVVKKGEYKIGENVLYLEVDSWVPHKIAPFLSKGNEPREYNGVLGERLRTVRLRGQLSQGLILPLSTLTGYIDEALDGDFSNVLGVQKWEAPVPAQLSGDVVGGFPTRIPKTDQERCQNLYVEIFSDHITESYEITEKLEGTSMTVYKIDDEVGVCGRNWNLTEDDNNTLWKTAKSCGLIDFLKNTCKQNIAIQGELIGEGIQKNYYGIKGHRFCVYDVYDITNGEYWGPQQRSSFILALPLPELYHVPILDFVECSRFDGLDDMLKYAEGKSALNNKKEREGVVFKSHQSEFHFKIVSNKFLMKTGG
jgi:RNA ligase (TIGR02306 family)